MSGFKFNRGFITEKTNSWIYTHKVKHTRPLTTMVLWEKLCCWKLYKHMISYNFLYLFLNQRTSMFSLMHTGNTNNIQCKPVSVWFLHICPILLREMGPRFTGHRSLWVTWFFFFFVQKWQILPPKMNLLYF